MTQGRKKEKALLHYEVPDQDYAEVESGVGSYL